VFALEDLRDLTTAVARCRHLATSTQIRSQSMRLFRKDPLLRPLVKRLPGIRIPGAADGFELATRAVIGQQVSVTGARTIAGRLAAMAGSPLKDASLGLTPHLPDGKKRSPSSGASSPEAFPMPAGRRRATDGFGRGGS